MKEKIRNQIKKCISVFLALVLVVGMCQASLAVRAAGDDISLNGDEAGKSSMNGTYTISGEYTYMGFVTLKEPTSDYKYLQFTYSGDITYLRLEFEMVATKSKSAIIWMNPDQDKHFVTASGGNVPLTGGGTVTIDLAKAGINLANYDGVHMHNGDKELAKNTLTISNAKLLKSAGGSGGSSSSNSQTISAKDVTKEIGSKAFKLNAKVKKGDGKLTYKSSNTKVAKVDSKGKVTLGKKCGIAKITITAKGTSKYDETTKTITVTVSPKKPTLSSVENTASQTFTANWDKISTATGYEIRYSTDKNLKKSVKKVSISKKDTTSKAVNKLTNGKTYYVQIRSFAKVSGKKVYSDWSKKKSVTVNEGGQPAAETPAETPAQ